MASDLLSTPPPLAPPKTWDATVSWLRLIRSHRVGPTTFFRLLAEHGTAEAALQALPAIAGKAGVAKYAPFSAKAAEQELKIGKRIGATLVCYGAAGYPALLAEITDPPPLMWAIGDVSLTERPAIALVGARNASSLGTRMATSLATGLGEAGFTIASGLARGIDTAAHLATLDTGTVAIQAGGVDVTYPKENAALHDQIAKSGLRLSEQPLGMEPIARHFPRRNRIISGMSRAVVVVEAAAKSGSLITAREALDQGRDVLAVPGHPFDARAAGCNMLIRDGAALVRSSKDILEALAKPQPKAAPKTPRKRPVHNAGPAHAQILGLLGPTPVAEDQLIRDLDVHPDLVTPQLLALELEGKITRQAGGLLSRL
ncbi:DNA-processing protein DprA [uncultured Litoreibacter sp.]|uniref:DNA-processing protein DprA n=1 Tax=uncultured Litoreibacter sp. TaxID=1392394 RepID=UPI002617BAA6|nr:DNA-processing protein DprA [uncultured Litoreibacter sp.]